MSRIKRGDTYAYECECHRTCFRNVCHLTDALYIALQHYRNDQQTYRKFAPVPPLRQTRKPTAHNHPPTHLPAYHYPCAALCIKCFTYICLFTTATTTTRILESSARCVSVCVCLKTRHSSSTSANTCGACGTRFRAKAAAT